MFIVNLAIWNVPFLATSLRVEFPAHEVEHILTEVLFLVNDKLH